MDPAGLEGLGLFPVALLLNEEDTLRNANPMLDRLMRSVDGDFLLRDSARSGTSGFDAESVGIVGKEEVRLELAMIEDLVSRLSARLSPKVGRFVLRELVDVIVWENTS